MDLASRYNAIPGISLGTKLFLHLRWWLTPYERMAVYVPKTGKVLDIGCGHGLLAMEMALSALLQPRTARRHDHQSLYQPATRLLAREVNQQGGLISKLNQFYEKMAALADFTQSNTIQAKENLSFKSQTGWQAKFVEHGFNPFIKASTPSVVETSSSPAPRPSCAQTLHPVL